MKEVYKHGCMQILHDGNLRTYQLLFCRDIVWSNRRRLFFLKT